jgi:hypothetical protein
MYRPNSSSKPVRVTPGQVYGMRVVLEAPVAAADAEAGMKPRLVPVSMASALKWTGVNFNGVSECLLAS